MKLNNNFEKLIDEYDEVIAFEDNLDDILSSTRFIKKSYR
jgi:hypothetical protein